MHSISYEKCRKTFLIKLANDYTLVASLIARKFQMRLLRDKTLPSSLLCTLNSSFWACLQIRFLSAVNHALSLKKSWKKMEGTLFSLSLRRRGVINAKKERFCEFTRVRVNVQGHMWYDKFFSCFCPCLPETTVRTVREGGCSNNSKY